MYANIYDVSCLGPNNMLSALLTDLGLCNLNAPFRKLSNAAQCVISM